MTKRKHATKSTRFEFVSNRWIKHELVVCRLYVRLPPSWPCHCRPPHPFPPAFFFSPLAAVRDSRRLLHPYREALSSVDFWEASGTGLSARQLEIGLERRRITGKLSSALLHPAKAPSLAWPPSPAFHPPAPIFHFAFDRTAPRASPSTTRTRTKGHWFPFSSLLLFFFSSFEKRNFSRTYDGSTVYLQESIWLESLEK